MICRFYENKSISNCKLCNAGVHCCHEDFYHFEGLLIDSGL